MIFKIFALVIFILYHARLLVLGENYIKSLKTKSSRSLCPTIPNVQENKEGQREAAQLPTVRARSCAWPQPAPARASFTDPQSNTGGSPPHIGSLKWLCVIYNTCG